MSGSRYLSALRRETPARWTGIVRAASAVRIEATGPTAAVGDMCLIRRENHEPLMAEVIAVGRTAITLCPLENAAFIEPGATVERCTDLNSAPVGDAFAGRAVDAFGAPIDDGASILHDTHRSLHGEIIPPLQREGAAKQLETGLRVIDALLPIGRGQRIGIFAASGVGKTSLISELALNTTSDRVVICQVGERGREVEALWRTLSQRADRERFTCVAATSDLSAPIRARAVRQALALSEHWRDQGQHVLLIIDSITRFAMALREIGLAAGAPPTLRAYTPDVFAALPRIVERCGGARDGGAITAIMTVLSETDDVDDPIVEIMKSLLDGHILLSRPLADQGHFPAVDVLRSVSRLAPQLMTPAHASAAQRATTLLAAYDEARPMIETGLYKSGADRRIDDVVRLRPALMRCLRQSIGERTSAEEAVQDLQKLTREFVHA